MGRAVRGSFRDSSSRGRRLPGSSGEQPAVADQELRQLILVAGSLSFASSPQNGTDLGVSRLFSPPCFPWTATHLYFSMCPFETVHDSGLAHPTVEPRPAKEFTLEFFLPFLPVFPAFHWVGGGWSSASPMSAPWQKWTDYAIKFGPTIWWTASLCVSFQMFWLSLYDFATQPVTIYPIFKTKFLPNKNNNAFLCMHKHYTLSDVSVRLVSGKPFRAADMLIVSAQQ